MQHAIDITASSANLDDQLQWCWQGILWGSILDCPSNGSWMTEGREKGKEPLTAKKTPMLNYDQFGLRALSWDNFWIVGIYLHVTAIRARTIYLIQSRMLNWWSKYRPVHIEWYHQCSCIALYTHCSWLVGNVTVSKRTIPGKFSHAMPCASKQWSVNMEPVVKNLVCTIAT